MNYPKLLLSGFLAFLVLFVKADEGMWLPQLLQKLNESRMKSLGMKISAKDIYSINNGSLKDAVVNFGDICTGNVISEKGLVLTNHHCGFDAIQNHSSLDKNYIRDGFWAKNRSEELPNKGLFVTFIIRIDDVTRDVLEGVTGSMTENVRQSTIDKNINKLDKKVKKESTQESFVRGFFEANQYYLFITETYKDVRMVGAPPTSIGNFGKDTDNWVWPRHTGDFSMFRIYAGKDNKPADYSPENVAYKSKRSFPISLDGVDEGDFTMVFGFPGTTKEYLHSTAVEHIMSVSDPAKIAIRGKALDIIDSFIRKDEQIKIQYVSKYANIQNAYKKWQGEVLGLKLKDGVLKKKMYEAEFQKRVLANQDWKIKYGSLLEDLGKANSSIMPYALAKDYYTEIIQKVELFTIASQLNSLISAYNKDEKTYQLHLPIVGSNIESLLSEYNIMVDRKLFESMMEIYLKDQDSKNVSPLLKDWFTASDKDYLKLTDKVYDRKNLYTLNELKSLLNKPAAEVVAELTSSPVIQLFKDIQTTYQSKVQMPSVDFQNNINKLQRTYMQAQMEVIKEKVFYPDANKTLRLTYGSVKGYSAHDAVKYDYYTVLDGVIEKYKPGDYEFDVPEKLRLLQKNKDYGKYGNGGKMNVCFIGTNHTTGGNSGSPVLDAYGNLTGLNFDRVWEGTMSDINYDLSICRNIAVDIRYILFIIDKFAGAGYLVNEMKLVHPKRRK